jgi:Ca2+-transporting ATPase
LILIFAGILTVLLREFSNAIVIFAAVLANTAFGFYQEYKAESTLKLLEAYLKHHARVVRDDREQEIEAENLVPGDIIRLRQGDRVPADARFIFVNDLQADEAILTGESLPVSKSVEPVPFGAALADRLSMAYAGTLIVQGMGDAVVTATAAHTELGKIMRLIGESHKKPTPLQAAISSFAFRASVFLGTLVLILFLLGLRYGYGVLEMFLITVAVAVSAVPEALPVALTVILSIGMRRIAERKGIIRKLVATETLGSTTIILTDKTGTLTEAKMALDAVLPIEAISFKTKDIDKAYDEKQKEILRLALLNSNVVIENPNDDPRDWRVLGRALEVALVCDAAEGGILLPQILRETKIEDRLPFNSASKYSGVLLKFANSYLISFVGAPEILLKHSQLTEKVRQETLKAINNLASSGARVLGVAVKEIKDGAPTAYWKKLHGLNFAGLIALRDPVRLSVKDAIMRIQDAGVRTVIVTGDHPGTAEAVAREAGLNLKRNAIVLGEDLELLPEAEFKRLLYGFRVFARVSPEQKLKIVRAYKNLGETVAMTGDGVNDAPALQEADIGIAVGSGTDVAKSVADLVILDDNFETIVAAIEEGRKTLENIRKVIVYLLSNAFGELFLIGGSLLAGLALPLNALQILWVNLFSDSFPAMALGFENVDDVGRKPKRLSKSLLDSEMKFLLLFVGTLTSFLLFALYVLLLAMRFDPHTVRTFIFASFGIYSLFLVFAVRSLKKSIFEYGVFSNSYLLGGVAVGFVLMGLAIYWPPLAAMLDTVPLSLPWLLGAFAVGIFNILVIELGKLLYRDRV